MKVAVTASELWGKTGVNPWENTADYASLAQVMIDVRSMRIKSLAEINKRMFEGNKPNWSFTDWQRVIALYVSLNTPTQGAGDYSRSHPIAKMYFDRLTAEYMDKKGKIGKPEEFTTKYMLLEKAFMDPEVWRNPTKMDACFDGLMEPVRQARARSWLKDYFVGGPLKVGYHALWGGYELRPVPEPQNVKGQPTPEALRRQNTREAYEKGVELGYWQ